uniref:Uncharacterized protein n=1 Tax=Geobacter sp. (strain M21) TaxID=443144 RepID=C6E133_GEOSM
MHQLSPLDIPLVNSWLNQFDTADRYIAIRFLLSLKYVSFEEFEEFIQSSVTQLVTDIITSTGEKRPIALFPVYRDTATEFNTEKEKKLANDSAGRIGHALVNLQRQLGRKVEVSPRKASMVSSKVRHLVFVDDCIGSGDRFISFWKNSVPKYMKSWISRGWCKVWIVAYAVHSKGLKKIIRNIRCVGVDHFVTNYLIEKSSLLDNGNIENLLKLYGARTSKKNASLGYGKQAMPIVFQHGCPNNAPGILWAPGGKNPEGVISIKNKRWAALFPERGIPVELYPLFQSDLKVDNLPELLWSSGQYRLALSFIESVDFPRKSPNTFIILTILALLSSGSSPDKIKNILMMTEVEFSTEFKKLVEFQLCDNTGQVTSFGKDVLKRNKRIKYKKSLEKQYEIYYPSTFMGLQREV